MRRRLGLGFVLAAGALGAVGGAVAARHAVHAAPFPPLRLSDGPQLLGVLDLYSAGTRPSQVVWAVVGAALLGGAALAGVLVSARRRWAAASGILAMVVAGAFVGWLLADRWSWSTGVTKTVAGPAIGLHATYWHQAPVASAAIGGAMLGLVAVAGVAAGRR